MIVHDYIYNILFLYKLYTMMYYKLFKGSPEGSSDQEFRGSILCDMIEIS